MSLEADLAKFFEKRGKTIIIGVGNPLRGDDGVGMKILEYLDKMDLNDVMLLNTETVPEAFTGKVSEYKPTHVLLVDAANFRSKPGDAMLISSAQIGGTALSTHSLPLTIFISYIEKTLNVKVKLLGIQPKRVEFYSEMTQELEEASKKISEILGKILKQNS
jgi:hydrogenase 3 maturation protease